MLDFIVNILSTPAILVGLLAMVGLILQRKPLEDIVKGSVKTIVGFLVISAGANFLTGGSLLAFGEVFNYSFSMQGVVPNNEAVVSEALTKFGQASAMIMCFGMVANIILARFSKWNYIFLTGHHTLYMACMIAIILAAGGLNGWQLWLAGGALLGLVMVISPAICQSTVRKITKNDSIAFGHFGGVGYALSANVAKLFKGSKSTEEIKFPKRLTFLRDTTVSIGLTMVVFFIVVTGIAVSKGILSEDPTKFANLGQLLNVGTETKTNWIVWSLTCGLSFAGAVYIILSGVRLIVGEIVPAFKGIAEKLVPGAKPALDCPIVYPYAPNAVLIGFLVSFVGGIVGLLILSLLNSAGITLAGASWALILPGVVPHFFCGATAGVFGNAEGGVKGAVFGSFVHGLFITLMPALVMPIFTNMGFQQATFSDADFSVMSLIFGNIARLMHGNGLLIVCLVIYCLPILLSIGSKKKV